MLIKLRAFLRQDVISKGMISGFIKISSIVLNMLIMIALARMLGPAELGLYSLIISIVTMLSVPSELGLSRLAVREVTKASLTMQWTLMKGFMTWSVRFILVSSLVVASLSILVSELATIDDSFANPFYLALFLVPLVALGNLRGAILQGLSRVVLGLFPENLFRPAIFLLLILAVGWIYGSSGMTAYDAIKAQVIAALLSFVLGGVLLWKSLSPEIRSTSEREYKTSAWLAAMVPLALTSGMQQINKGADIVLISSLGSVDEAGVYRIASQIATFVVFGHQILAMIAAPYFARNYASGKIETLQGLVRQIARLSFFFALPTTILFAVFGKVIIELLFGAEYRSGYFVMMILCVGQLINSFFGHVGILLNMTGHERSATRGMALSALINILLNIALIPVFGMLGAAIASTVSITVWNVVLWLAVSKNVGIRSSAF